MKKLILISICIIGSLVAKSQFPINQTIGSDSTLVTSKGGLKGRIVLFSYADTTSANLQRISQYPFALIATTNDTLWFRNSTNTAWVKVGAGGGGGGSGTVTSLSTGNLSPLFTASITNPTTTPALSFAASNISQFQILGRKASGSGAYSFLTADSSLITDLHSENYYNTKYAPSGTATTLLTNVGSGNGWVKTLSGATYPIKSPTQGFAIAITSNTNDLAFAVDTTQLRDTLNISNAGAGLNILYAVTTTATNKTIFGKRFQAGSNITLTQNADSSITIIGGAGTSYTFSTGLTLATTTVTSNLSTGVSGGQTATGSTSTNSGLNLLTTTSNSATTGAYIRMISKNSSTLDTSFTLFNDGNMSFGTTTNAGGFYVRKATKILFDNALHVWDMITIDSNGFFKRLPIGVNGKFVGVQGDTLAYITGGQTNSNVGSGFRLAIPLTNNIKTLTAGTGITIDSSTSNQINITGINLSGNAVNRVATGSNTANTLVLSADFTWNHVDEVKFTPTGGNFYWTILNGATNFIYFTNTDIQVYPNNLLTASFNGTSNKTYFQSEGSLGAKAAISSTDMLQIDNTATEYVATGSSPLTWFLPAIATANNNRWYIVKNRSSAILTVSDPGAATSIYTNAAVVSVTIAPGGSMMFVSDATYWLVTAVNTNSTPAWTLAGNSGTTVGTHFIGTSDNVALSFKTNATEAMRISTTQNVGVGTAATYRLDVLNAATGQTASNRISNFSNSGGTFNTTGGVLGSYGIYTVSSSTRSAGANALTNYGTYSEASGAQFNFGVYAKAVPNVNNAALYADGDIIVSGGATMGYIAKTSTYTAAAGDYVIDCTSGTFTVNLPAVSGLTGKIFFIKNSGTGVITIDGNSSETIDGSTTKTLSVQYSGYEIMCTGSSWAIISTF